jgi:hypothetical protein
MPRPAKESDLAPSESLRPMTNPRRSDAIDRGNENIRFEQSEQNDVLLGKRFAEGGMIVSRAQLSGTKFSGTF